MRMEQAEDRYSFEELVAHLHDAHGMNAESMADDEECNGTDAAIIARIRAFTRDEALDRLPYHYFMGTQVARDSSEALASARLTHREEHAQHGADHGHPAATAVAQ